MKYLLVLLVIVVAVWMFTARSRPRVRRDEPPVGKAGTPQAMARCAHCGLHLPAADAIIDGASVYCSEAHRRLGQGPAADR